MNQPKDVTSEIMAAVVARETEKLAARRASAEVNTKLYFSTLENEPFSAFSVERATFDNALLKWLAYVCDEAAFAEALALTLDDLHNPKHEPAPDVHYLPPSDNVH